MGVPLAHRRLPESQRAHAAAGESEARRQIRRRRRRQSRRHPGHRQAPARRQTGAWIYDDRHRENFRRRSERSKGNSGPARHRSARSAAQENRRPGHPPRQSRSGRMRGKISGHERLTHRGPARVFESRRGSDDRGHQQADQSRRRRRHPQRRPKGRSRNARDAGRNRGHCGRGIGRLRRAANRRPLQRRHARPDDRPRLSGSRAGRPNRRVCTKAT